MSGKLHFDVDTVILSVVSFKLMNMPKAFQAYINLALCEYMD